MRAEVHLPVLADEPCPDPDMFAPPFCPDLECRHNTGGALPMCAIEVANLGPQNSRCVARAIGLSAAGAGQLERRALKTLRRRVKMMGMSLDQIVERPRHMLDFGDSEPERRIYTPRRKKAG